MGDLIQLAIAAVGGGGLMAITRYLIDRSKEDRLDFQAIMATLSEDNLRLRKENEILRMRIVVLEEHEVELTRRVAELESIVDRISNKKS